MHRRVTGRLPEGYWSVREGGVYGRVAGVYGRVTGVYGRVTGVRIIVPK